jgi:hypothetical protein
MDKIMETVENICVQMDILNDDDKTLLEMDIIQHLVNIHNSLNSIKSRISDYKPCLTKCHETELVKRRNKVIWNVLFPFYWDINQYISCLDDDILSEVEKETASQKY